MRRVLRLLFVALPLTLVLSACSGETRRHYLAEPPRQDAAFAVEAGPNADATLDGGDAAVVPDGDARSDAEADGGDGGAPRDGGIDGPTRDAAIDGPVTDARGNVVDAAEDGPSYEVPPGYPAGPYGRAVGDTLAPLRWEGYATPSGIELARDQTYGPYSADDLRRSGKGLALIHFADFDCPGCRSGAADLATRAAELSLVGAAVVEVLISKQYFDPATKAHLDAWVSTYDLTSTTVIDAPGYELDSLEAVGIRETAVIVELGTMEILWRATGDLFGIGDSSVDLAAAELLSRLSGG